MVIVCGTEAVARLQWYEAAGTRPRELGWDAWTVRSTYTGCMCLKSTCVLNALHSQQSKVPRASVPALSNSYTRWVASGVRGDLCGEGPARARQQPHLKQPNIPSCISTPSASAGPYVIAK
jgi:hypothetical protein